MMEGFPGGSESKASACNVGDLGLIPGSGSSPGVGNSNPLQYTCLESSMHRGAWWATSLWGGKESDMTERMCMHILIYDIINVLLYDIMDIILMF